MFSLDAKIVDTSDALSRWVTKTLQEQEQEHQQEHDRGQDGDTPMVGAAKIAATRPSGLSAAHLLT